MSTLPSITQLSVGQSLSTIANKTLGNYSLWREIATLNNINIFQPSTIGKNISIPNPKQIESMLNSNATTQANNVLKTLDLSSLSKGLTSAATNEFRLISWVL